MKPSTSMTAVSPAHPDVAGAIALPQADAPARAAGILRRFRRHKVGFASLVVFAILFASSLLASCLANDRPLVARYDGRWLFPALHAYADRQFGGALPTEADYLDPFIRDQFARPGNFALYAPDHYRYDTVAYHAARPFPAPPSAENWLGTDAFGRDVFARALYGFRSSILFAAALTLSGALVGVLAGAVLGYHAGRVDLVGQRLIEIWNALPDLYLLIILSSIFEPSLPLLFALLAAFGWITLSDYVRGEFLRQRSLDYVRAARTLGLSDWQIMRRHILPNSLTPVITYLPFRMSAAIVALTSLDFLGMGVPPPAPSLGELLAEGKAHLDAWWISATAIGVLVVTLLLLTFIGDALREVFAKREQAGVGAGDL
ncbi:peptide ABC transporter permease [Burkholderia cepacia]|uniref:Peptide ABC transporter permease n=3 Tax=Burkholderia TaxID=32008 RepID=A0A1B4PLM6_BURCE|nr:MULTISPECIES: ABC transporter permease [Burkholderia cepacia complex]AOK14811.1 peptide ABC transporter permease [Burkholderia cepacia]AOK21530.1 peptide ABC transporter permease [Burkholderia ubonensis]KVL07617.1 peptide ABC transporter permease [Burkholderia ubonensis]KVQ59155.1 peptide ABC transporter permease [Burkholderia ubonensis]